MKNLSIPQALAERAVKKDDLEFHVNKEVHPILRKLRETANYASTSRATVDTVTPGVYKEIWRSEAMPSDGTWDVFARVVGTSVFGPQHAVYWLAAGFQSVATAPLQIGATAALLTLETAPAIDARFGLDVGNRQVYLEVVDDGAAVMRFVAVVSVIEASTS